MLTVSVGQNKIDSLSRLIAKETIPSEKAQLQLKRGVLFGKNEREKGFDDLESALSFFTEKKYNEGETDSYIAYGNLHFIYGEPKQAAHYDSLAIQLAEKISYKKGRAVAIGNLGREFINFGNFNKAEELIKQAIELEENSRNQDAARLAELYSRYNIIAGSQGNYLKSLSLIEKAMEFAAEINDDKQLALLYTNYAITLSRLSKFDEAVEFHFKVIRICEKMKDTTGLLRVYNNLGIAFRNGDEFDKAITYYKKSIALSKQAANHKSLGLSLVNLATVYIAKERYDGVDTLYTQGIRYFEMASDTGGIAFANHNYGNFLVITKNYTEADKRLQKAYELRKQIGAELAAASSLSVLGKSAMEQKKWKEAEEYLLAAEPIYKGKSRSNRNLKELYGYLKELYTQEGNFEKALYYQTQELDLERTLFTENEKVNALKTETAYEMEKRDMQMALQKEKQELARQQFLIIGGGVALILLLLSLSLWLRRKQLKERHQAQIVNLDQEHRLNLSKSLKSAEQEERKKIAHKLHDEAGSMLSIAILNLKQLQGDVFKTESNAEKKLDTTQKILVDISDSVRNISHTLMPVALEKYGLKAAIHDLVNAVNTSQKLKVEEILEGLDDTSSWGEDFCLTVYRILQEAMNNIIKHAQASHVVVQIVELEDSVTIYIEDNGRGMNTDAGQEGIGLKILKSNVEYLNGTIEINGDANKGTFILAELPIEKKKHKKKTV
ncbi:tetratricopeptide repeat-containing sensor histidine kinase [Aequorivita lipolytica]|uniref:tetratricopeptide repeat-containing sensor histidine kinase n=1 Tax=Aequorivita lipolytica TaxID=153267 RepID=UPI00135C4E98|nr:sensor histidine kinase [Aequorivita lipolytica]